MKLHVILFKGTTHYHLQLLIISKYFYFHIMSYIPDWKHIQESEAFNWKCVICSVVALSPMFAEAQWLVQYGPYKDIDGVTLWLKFSERCTPCHLKCLPNSNKITPWEIYLHFHGLQKLISFNFSIALPLLYSCLSLIIFVSFFFSFVISGRGTGGSGERRQG